MNAFKNPRVFTGSRTAFEMLKQFSESGNQPRFDDEIGRELIEAVYAPTRFAELAASAKGLKAAHTIPRQEPSGEPQFP